MSPQLIHSAVRHVKGLRLRGPGTCGIGDSVMRAVGDGPAGGGRPHALIGMSERSAKWSWLSAPEVAVEEVGRRLSGLGDVRFHVIEVDVLVGVQPDDLLLAGLALVKLPGQLR